MGPWRETVVDESVAEWVRYLSQFGDNRWSHCFMSAHQKRGECRRKTEVSHEITKNQDYCPILWFESRGDDRIEVLVDNSIQRQTVRGSHG